MSSRKKKGWQRDPEHLGSERKSACHGGGEATDLLSVKERGLADKTLDVSHSTVSLVNGHLSNDKILVLSLELLDLLGLLGDLLSQALLEGL